MVRKKLLFVASAAVIALAGIYYYFSLSSPQSKFADVRALVTALEGEGIPCDQLNVSAPDPTPDLVDFGSCRMYGKTVNLHVYRNREALEAHIEGNLAAQGKNPNYFTSLVAGYNWVIDSYSDATSRRIQNAIGGVIH